MVKSKALLPLTPSLTRLGVRFGDVLTVLLMVLLIGEKVTVLLFYPS